MIQLSLTWFLSISLVSILTKIGAMELYQITKNFNIILHISEAIYTSLILNYLITFLWNPIDEEKSRLEFSNILVFSELKESNSMGISLLFNNMFFFQGKKFRRVIFLNWDIRNKIYMTWNWNIHKWWISLWKKTFVFNRTKITSFIYRKDQQK